MQKVGSPVHLSHIFVHVDRERWFNFIKDYEGGTLMEGFVCPHVDYLKLTSMLRAQRDAIHAKLQQVSNSHVIYDGLSLPSPSSSSSGAKVLIDPESIPGIRETGWTSQQIRQMIATTIQSRQNVSEEDLLKRAKMSAVYKQVRSLKDAWPFQEPVDTKAVADYLTVIAQPMDLRTIGQRLDSQYYKSDRQLAADLLLVVKNCKTYNPPDTNYWQLADSVEKSLSGIWREYFATDFPI